MLKRHEMLLEAYRRLFVDEITIERIWSMEALAGRNRWRMSLKNIREYYR